jgi:iron complex outermembrane receptor protein
MLDAGGQPVPAYTELDARLAWDLRPGVEVALLGRNLLDGSHPEMGTDAARREIARSVQVSLQWAF